MITRKPLGVHALRYLGAGARSLVGGAGPLFLTVFVTSRCGLPCGHCFCRQSSQAAPDLGLHEYQRITRTMPPVPKLILTGGEPFLRLDLPDIAIAFYEGTSRSRQITIPTSGVLRDPVLELVRRLLPGRPALRLELQLSIDGVGAPHDAIRGPGSFRALMATFEALRPLADLHPGLAIRFNFTFSPVTQRHFRETFGFVTQELGQSLDLVLLRGRPADPAFAAPIDLGLYEEASGLLQGQEWKRAGFSAFRQLLATRPLLEREIIARHRRGERALGRCSAGTLSAVLSETGELRPCELRDDSFGNVREQDLAASWRGARAVAFRREIARSRCFCTFETSVRTTLSFRPRSWVSMAHRWVDWKRRS